ncbi:hypothetical protein PQR46_19105 [Paraburkholderia sediminicola]|uniref:hypothetical protein n=1 Tax=Paraburkholderia sediminicola TaxID=458836 RepID=UPI0038B92548
MLIKVTLRKHGVPLTLQLSQYPTALYVSGYRLRTYNLALLIVHHSRHNRRDTMAPTRSPATVTTYRYQQPSPATTGYCHRLPSPATITTGYHRQAIGVAAFNDAAPVKPAIPVNATISHTGTHATGMYQ